MKIKSEITFLMKQKLHYSLFEQVIKKQISFD